MIEKNNCHYVTKWQKKQQDCFKEAAIGFFIINHLLDLKQVQQQERRMSIHPSVKRSISVVPPEEQVSLIDYSKVLAIASVHQQRIEIPILYREVSRAFNASSHYIIKHADHIRVLRRIS